MPYKVFFVEDEIAIREGIRDNVDWRAHGFEFCGEASDGEIALQLLQTIKPDVLITDIRMPFMDGLQLSQIVRDRLPSTKIIILSGHDEFACAQKAIKLGVFEYLLKPVSVQDLHAVLDKAAAALEQEQQELQALQKLQDQVEEHRAALRERFLLKLVTGAAAPVEAIAKSQALGLDLVARSYLVVLLRIESRSPSEPMDLDRQQRVQQLVAALTENHPDAYLLRTDFRELVLLLKGLSPENLNAELDHLLERIRQEVAVFHCELIVGLGTPQMRITEICHSYLDAVDNLRATAGERRGYPDDGSEKTDLLGVDRSAVEDLLKTGTAEDFTAFYEAFSRPLGPTALASPLVKSYVFTDIVLAAAKFVDELGGDVDQVIPELGSIGKVLANINTVEQLRERVQAVLVSALAFRDNRVGRHYDEVIRQAQAYIDSRFSDPALALSDVAVCVNLSACHFSAVFSQETGRTFKEYLTEIRIKTAKELLRTTALKAFEIGYQVGYNDPHYFSHVFHKNTGLTPMEFRAQAQAG